MYWQPNYIEAIKIRDVVMLLLGREFLITFCVLSLKNQQQKALAPITIRVKVNTCRTRIAYGT